MIPVIYGELCPQCHRDLRWDEIEEKVCHTTHRELSHTKLSEIYEEFEEFFKAKFGKSPRAIQRMWARRVLNGYSFAAIAPTGIGKTSFGIIMAMFLASKGKKSYLIVPTTLILKEIVKKIEEMKFEDFAYYHSGMKKEDKEKMTEKMMYKMRYIIRSINTI
jgi:reverse gyrase